LLRIRSFLGDHAVELPIGIDRVLFSPGQSSVRSSLHWSEEHQVLGYVGRLIHLKGVDLLVTGVKELLHKMSNLRLLIVGSGEEAENIRRAFSNELTAGVVHIEPDINHEMLGDWYRAMDLLVMPSRYENFSNAILEAMACGTPFLAANVGGNKIIANTGGGWVFEAGSALSLSTLLETILTRDWELKYRGTLGLSYVQRQHSWSSTAKYLEQIIESRL
jgi:D-inositol-3-phosphate glycosyltransferase